MNWEATDQFGNMYIGVSDAQSDEELEVHLRSMADEVFARRSDGVTISVNPVFGDISAPDPHQPSHILQVEWLTRCSETSSPEQAFERVESIWKTILREHAEWVATIVLSND